MSTYTYKSPIGLLLIIEQDGYIVGVNLMQDKDKQIVTESHSPTALLQETCTQLTEYFAGKRTSFNLPIKFTTGTPFQHSVWNALREIPYGETRSYEDIAVAIGNPKAVRAIGQANHNNPVLLLVPCHRVINKNGSLGGFGCGVEIKKRLLQLEGVL